MLKSTPRPLTAHDYRELPDAPPYYQLIEGELCMSPSPSWYHQQILTNIADLLLHNLRDNPIGKVYFAPLDTYLTDLNVYQPDLLFVSNARKSILAEDGVQGAPDFVVEILSPRTAKYDRGAKRDIYARTGDEELWLVYPELKSIQVYRFAESPDNPVATYNAKQTFTTLVFPGLNVSVADVLKH
jgi:Uma2 family endonuclease